MKAIILAAGIGSRLRPITDTKPKTLVKVNNKPILGYILEALYRGGIKEVVVCVGFKASEVINFCKNNYPKVKFYFIENKTFQETNNMFSLFLAKEFLNDDIILMNGDVVIEGQIIEQLVRQKETIVAVDGGKYREESMKIIVRNGIIKNISKEISKNESYGCSIDIYKIIKKDVGALVKEMQRIIEKNKNRNAWTEVMLDNLFSSGKIVARPMDIKNKHWIEVDDYNDLLSAELLFNNKIRLLKNKKVFFLDLDGTVVLGEKFIAGAVDFLKALKKKKKSFFIATNNSSKTPRNYINKLKEYGIIISQKNVLISSSSAISFLKENDIKRVFWVANKRVSKYLTKSGLFYSEKNPQAVLLTYDDEINYEKLVKIINFIRKGVPYYATHIDITCPTPEGSIPDIGTFIKIIQMTTGILPNETFGKPNKSFINPTLKERNLSYKDAVIIGDRLYTDIKTAANSNITSVLVLTGETKREDYENNNVISDIIVNSIFDLIKYV
jgi:HAD superfamily hydrolase (TIGR01450 family)